MLEGVSQSAPSSIHPFLFAPPPMLLWCKEFPGSSKTRSNRCELRFRHPPPLAGPLSPTQSSLPSSALDPASCSSTFSSKTPSGGLRCRHPLIPFQNMLLSPHDYHTQTNTYSDPYNTPRTSYTHTNTEIYLPNPSKTTTLFSAKPSRLFFYFSHARSPPYSQSSFFSTCNTPTTRTTNSHTGS